MDKVFIRNFVVFVVILLGCAGALSYFLLKGDKSLDKSDELVIRSHSIITEAEQLSTLVEGMLAAQRGYLLTGDKVFLKQYRIRKANVSEHIAALSELTELNASQQSRLDEVRSYFTDFSKKLEERSQSVEPQPKAEVLTDIEIIDGLRSNIVRINHAILKEEYTQLNRHFHLIDGKKSEYFNTLMISVGVGTILLLVINGFLLYAQRKRSHAEASLKDTEERFALAVDGTQDGIFDWDIQDNSIFYSRRFFEMIGYDRKAFVGKPDDFEKLIHPEDVETVKNNVDLYLNGELSEYDQSFRVKHASGRWVWIQSRAKALFDRDGHATRMVGAHTDITPTVKTTERLQNEKQQAEDANRAKSEFLAHMSHEIRTPLTAISGIAEIFEKGKDSLNEKQQRLISTLLGSTSSLKDLINDILDFSKIESRELELDEQAFMLDEVFENVISMMSLKASEKGVSFVFDYRDFKKVEFYGDAKRIRQILVNLVNNAIKFTDKGGVTIKATADHRDGHEFLRIDVADTGIGIAPENFDLVFERFKQADSSVSRRFGGTGLGLPISRNLAQLMGGDIFLSSELGKGSTFTVLLPMKLTGGKKEKRQAHAENKLNDQIRASITGDHKILMVEDYEGNIVVISYILEDIGVKFDIARTGAEAVKMWQKNHYDIVLMDIQMPEMDGFTATKKIRRAEHEKKLDYTPIIGMTAHALVGDKDKCIEAGMDAYLPKPIVEADLKREILKYIKPRKKKVA